MDDDHPDKIARRRDEKILEIAIDTRKFEISLFWQRSLFFWGFIASAFFGYFAIKDADPSLRFPIGCFGIVCSVAWALVTRGSKYWHEAWEQKVAAAQDRVLGQPLFSRSEPVERKGIIWNARRFSVSKLTMALSDFIVLVWIVLAATASPGLDWRNWNWQTVAMLVVTVVYVISMLIGGRSSPNERQKLSPLLRGILGYRMLSRPQK
jgi:hypothetical protein